MFILSKNIQLSYLGIIIYHFLFCIIKISKYTNILAKIIVESIVSLIILKLLGEKKKKVEEKRIIAWKLKKGKKIVN